MRPRATATILLVALALAAVYWFVERPRQQRAERRARAASRLAPFAVEEASALSIARGDTSLAFVLRATRWDMTAPLEDVADAGAVGTFLGALADAEVERDLGAQTERTPYGLSPPEVTVVVQNARGDTLVHLDLGRTTVDRAWAYARLAGSPDILLVPTAVRRYAASAVEDYRSRRALAFDLSVVHAFAVAAPGRRMSWWRDGSDGWSGASGADTAAGDPRAVEAVLRRLRGLRAARFIDPPAADALMTRARHSVDIEKQSPHPAIHLDVLLTDSASAFTRVAGETRAVEVDSSVAEVFRQSLASLRERRLMRFDAAAVRRLEIVTPDTSATLVRTGNDWFPPHPGLGRVHPARVRSLMEAALTLRFDRILGAAPATAAGAPEVAFLLVVRGDGGTLLDEMTCRRSGPSRYRASSRSSGLSGEIDAARLEALASAARRLHP
jgi:type II secretory pathway pseudopilin PulG